MSGEAKVEVVLAWGEGVTPAFFSVYQGDGTITRYVASTSTEAKLDQENRELKHRVDCLLGDNHVLAYERDRMRNEKARIGADRDEILRQNDAMRKEIEELTAAHEKAGQEFAWFDPRRKSFYTASFLGVKLLHIEAQLESAKARVAEVTKWNNNQAETIDKKLEVERELAQKIKERDTALDNANQRIKYLQECNARQADTIARGQSPAPGTHLFFKPKELRIDFLDGSYPWATHLTGSIGVELLF